MYNLNDIIWTTIVIITIILCFFFFIDLFVFLLVLKTLQLFIIYVIIDYKYPISNQDILSWSTQQIGNLIYNEYSLNFKVLIICIIVYTYYFLYVLAKSVIVTSFVKSLKDLFKFVFWTRRDRKCTKQIDTLVLLTAYNTQILIVILIWFLALVYIDIGSNIPFMELLSYIPTKIQIYIVILSLKSIKYSIYWERRFMNYFRYFESIFIMILLNIFMLEVNCYFLVFIIKLYQAFYG